MKPTSIKADILTSLSNISGKSPIRPPKIIFEPMGYAEQREPIGSRGSFSPIHY
jgi:hypothetical protein